MHLSAWIMHVLDQRTCKSMLTTMRRLDATDGPFTCRCADAESMLHGANIRLAPRRAALERDSSMLNALGPLLADPPVPN